MNQRGHDTREQILKTGSHLVQTRGFSAMSFGQIAELLAIKPPAIHYHFPSKTDLGLALVERYRQRYQRWMDEAADQGLSVTESLSGYIRIASRFHDDGRKVCPLGILTAELLALPAELVPAVCAMNDDLLNWLESLLERGRADGSLRFKGEARDVAIVITASLQGALQLSRAMGRQAFDAVVRELWLGLGRDSVEGISTHASQS
jgi:TetR/AcrR family transcriptional repressor of nem operon